MAEYEWIQTFKNLETDIHYDDYKECATGLAKYLKEEKKCDLVVALAHMRTVRDLDLATVEDIDLVLGGHDHEYIVFEVNGKKIVKSGQDFKEFSEVTLHFNVSEEEFTLAKQQLLPDYDCSYSNKTGIFTQVLRIGVKKDQFQPDKALSKHI